MRMAGLWPRDIGGYECHRVRKGGDLGHVNPSRSHLNRRLLGSEGWAQQVHEEVQKMKLENHANELEMLQRRRRRRELERRLAEGPRGPWRATRHGPMREIILTANREWFDDDLTGFLGENGPTREEQFQALAVAWLTEHFGADCVHARADRDEEAYHIHAVILPRATTKDGRRMLQPSVHPMIRDYEKAQDSVGAWFAAAKIGLTRGERRKQAIRNALQHNADVREAQAKGEIPPGELVEVPKHRKHVSPRKWREAQERALAEHDRDLATRGKEIVAREATVSDREAAAEAKSNEAAQVLRIAADVAEGRGEIEEPEDTGAPSERKKHPSSDMSKPALASRLFGRALTTLRAKARAEAREELSRAFAEIKAADEAILAVAKLLPEGLRGAVAEARRSLSQRIVAMTRRQKEWRDRRQDSDPRS